MNDWTKEPWEEWPYTDKIGPIKRADYARARLCVNNLAGLNPEALGDVEKLAETLCNGLHDDEHPNAILKVRLKLQAALAALEATP